ncbi:C4-dicarboxylate ABC transporter permease [Gemmobacter nanjingensis]|uniref:C4-dicarboxylate ABC transporter permease n=1 Tax=Gemmobacter nanjingensis TaxID=488454 RepID=A0ABQ3FUP5_9RHOB|nr:TRAP transporter substrate-binding protein [Gemmobacter nanjingensis]GHC40587.1 C4-dicarboxylate ABC transporter permease [Gemmobacter nanjingensis]
MKFKTIGWAAGLAFLLSGGMAAAEQYRLGLITPPSHQWSVHAQKAADAIKEKTEGRVEISLFPSGQLGSEAQMLQQLQTGALDFAFLTVGEFANRDPNYGIFLAPYLVSDIEGAKTVLGGATAGKLLADMNKFGLVGLGWSSAGMRTVVMRGTIANVGDLAGKKIRTVPNAPELDFWTLLGATPTPMPLPALYDALANGQVDGAQLDHEGTWNTKYYDHAGTIIDSRHMMFPMVAVASGRKWQAISEEDRAAIQEIMTANFTDIIDAYGALDNKYMEDLKTTPVPVVTVDRAWFGPAVDKWYEDWRVKAPLLVELEAELASN